jgi:hypothetical protein
MYGKSFIREKKKPLQFDISKTEIINVIHMWIRYFLVNLKQKRMCHICFIFKYLAEIRCLQQTKDSTP